VEETCPPAPSIRVCDGHAESHLGPEIAQHRGIARPPLAKAEIRAHHDVAQPQPVGEDIAGKSLGAEAGKRRVEGQFIKPLDADLCQTMRACLGPHQAKGWCLGGEIGARMRLECQHAQRCADGLARAAGDLDDVAMAKVDTVEIADGGRGTPVGLGGKAMVAHDPHGSRVAPEQERRKPL